MKIEIVMQYDDAYAEIGNISSARTAEYAKRHGYEFHLSRKLPLPCPYWSKVKYMRMRSFDPADYIMWLDADTLILDMDRPLDGLISGNAMDVSQDEDGLCVGVFGVQNCVKARVLLGCWLFLGQTLDDDYTSLKEQGALMLLSQKFPAVNSLISRIPETLVANQQSNVSAPFIYHYWARGKNKAQVAHMMREKLNQTKTPV